MTVTLTKQITVTWSGGFAGQQATPGQPYIPPNCSVQLVSQNVISPSGAPPGSTTRWQPPTGNIVGDGSTLVPVVYTPQGGYLAPGSYGGASTSSSQLVSVLVCTGGQPYIPPTPAIPPSPAVATQSLNLGWNSGAISNNSFDVNGFVSAQFPGGDSGAAIGMGSVLTLNFLFMPYCWYVTQGLAYIYENGVLKAGSGGSLPINGGDTLAIERIGGTVYYLQNGIVMYTSSTQSLAGNQHLLAALFSGGDYIYNPMVGPANIASPSFLPLQGVGGNTVAGFHGFSHASFQPMTGGLVGVLYGGTLGTAGRNKVGGTPSFLPMAVEATGSQPGTGALLNVAMLAFQPLGVTAGVSPPRPPYAKVNVGFLPLQQGAGHGWTNGRGGTKINALDFSATFPVSFQPLLGRGWAYGTGSTRHGGSAPVQTSTSQTPNPGAQGPSFQPLTGWGGGSVPDKTKGVIGTFMGMGAFILNPLNVLLVTMTTNGTITNAYVVTAQFVAQMTSLITSNPNMTPGQVLAQLMTTSIAMGAQFPIFDNEVNSVWVLNAKTMATSRYSDDFAYNGFAQIGGTYFGIKQGGVYTLEGSDDAGDPIDAFIALGKRNFGTSFLKRLANAYVGLSSSGQMYLKVLLDGQEYVYQMRASNPNTHVQRFDLGKGLRSQYYELELHNFSGADFDLDSVQFQAAVLERRI